jgi:hypothetical protein
MPRQIKNFEFQDRFRDALEEYRAVMWYRLWYKPDDLKIHFMVNQFGKAYTDIYLRIGAQKKKGAYHGKEPNQNN